MLLSAVRKILTVVMAVILMVSITVTGFAQSEDQDTSVLWPCEIPFKIIVAQNGKQGIIYSEEFEVVNKSGSDVAIEVSAARIKIESDDDYYISDTRELPESGSNIFIELLWLDDEEASSTVLTDTPSGIVHTYNLKSGDTGKFKFDGTVNEMDGLSWNDAVVQIHLCFNIVGLEPIPPIEEMSDNLEGYEDFIDSDFNESETVNPSLNEETIIDLDTDDPLKEAGSNDLDDINTQESSTDTESDTEESDSDEKKAASQPEDYSSAESHDEESSEAD